MDLLEIWMKASGLPWWVSSKESMCQRRRCGTSPGAGNGNLGNPMDRGAWQATVQGLTRVRHDLVTKQQQQQWNFFLEKFRILSHFLEIHWLPKAHSCGVHHFQIMLIPHFKQQMLTFMEYLLFIRLWAVEHEVLQLILIALGGKSYFYFLNRWRINLRETDWLTQTHRANQ